MTSQPDRTNSVASQSSSSGWLGGSPWAPKSSTVFTSPVPKSICQSRLTATRAVSGLAGSTSQRARPSRSAFASRGHGADQRRDAGLDPGPGLVVLAADQDVRRRGAGISSMTIVVGISRPAHRASARADAISRGQPPDRRRGPRSPGNTRRSFDAWPGVRRAGGIAAIFVIDSGVARIAMASGAERPVVDAGSSIAPDEPALGTAAGADPQRLLGLERLIQLVQEHGRWARARRRDRP